MVNLANFYKETEKRMKIWLMRYGGGVGVLGRTGGGGVSELVMFYQNFILFLFLSLLARLIG